MPLYVSGSLESLVGAFGIGFILPFDHVSGTFPVSKHALKNLCKNVITLYPKYTCHTCMHFAIKQDKHSHFFQGHCCTSRTHVHS